MRRRDAARPGLHADLADRLDAGLSLRHAARAGCSAGPQYVDLQNLGPALRDPGLILDLMRLAYVPNYFDILPL